MGGSQYMRQDEALRAAGGFLLSRESHKHNMAITVIVVRHGSVGRSPTY